MFMEAAERDFGQKLNNSCLWAAGSPGRISVGTHRYVPDNRSKNEPKQCSGDVESIVGTLLGGSAGPHHETNSAGIGSYGNKL